MMLVVYYLFLVGLALNLPMSLLPFEMEFFDLLLIQIFYFTFYIPFYVFIFYPYKITKI